MALVRDISQAQLAFMIEGGAPDQFLVMTYKGTEGLCQLYRFEIKLCSEVAEVSLGDFVGKPAVLCINAAQGTRWFHGIISRFEMTGEGPDRSYYRAEMVPEIWLLTHRYNSRIFQGKKVDEIITDILEKAGIPSDRFRLSLDGTYEACSTARPTTTSSAGSWKRRASGGASSNRRRGTCS